MVLGVMMLCVSTAMFVWYQGQGTFTDVDTEAISLLGTMAVPRDAAFEPSWTHGGAMRYYDRSMAHGQWSPETGPPVKPLPSCQNYVAAVCVPWSEGGAGGSLHGRAGVVWWSCLMRPWMGLQSALQETPPVLCVGHSSARV